jgi:hypothetical protein
MNEFYCWLCHHYKPLDCFGGMLTNNRKACEACMKARAYFLKARKKAKA